MNEKLDKIQVRLEEISKLNLAEQPEAFAQLHLDLEQELNPTDNAQED